MNEFNFMSSLYDCHLLEYDIDICMVFYTGPQNICLASVHGDMNFCVSGFKLLLEPILCEEADRQTDTKTCGSHGDERQGSVLKTVRLCVVWQINI
jgi:hypothetical protein